MCAQTLKDCHSSNTPSPEPPWRPSPSPSCCRPSSSLWRHWRPWCTSRGTCSGRRRRCLSGCRGAVCVATLRWPSWSAWTPKASRAVGAQKTPGSPGWSWLPPSLALGPGGEDGRENTHYTWLTHRLVVRQKKTQGFCKLTLSLLIWWP